MPTLLIVHHSATPSMQALTDAAVAGGRHPDLDGAVAVVQVDALSARAEDVLAADAVVLVTPVNFGYMSGALKHFFDSTFRLLDGSTDHLPYGAIIKGTTDATGAVRAIESIAVGMHWRRVVPPVVIEGEVGESQLADATDLAATLAASVLL